MGSGIAEAAAVAGLPVVLRDVDDASLEAAEKRIEGSLTRAVRGGKLGLADAEEVRGRIELTNELTRSLTSASWSRPCRKTCG